MLKLVRNYIAEEYLGQWKVVWNDKDIAFFDYKPDAQRFIKNLLKRVYNYE
jgi:hypothetical protein